MKTTYETRGWLKFAEEVVWNSGCQPEGGFNDSGNDRFAADSIPALIAKLQAFCGSYDAADVLPDSCDTVGRVDIQVMETEESIAAHVSEVDRWKVGKCRLWLACYTFRIEKVTREDVTAVCAEYPNVD